jgi:U3 small nucleolar RNA-associated protein 7
MLTGNDRGVVKMWAPNTGVALASIFCHSSHVNDCAVTLDGNYMATVGSEGKLKVWDLRKMTELYEYWCPVNVNKISVSQKGILALGCKDTVVVSWALSKTWKDWYLEKQKAPYMKQELFNRKCITDLQFAPFEDVLGAGLDGGFSTMLIPGSFGSEHRRWGGQL